MRKSRIVLMLSLMACFLAAGARGDVSFGISGDQDGINEFHLAIGDFYHVPETQVTVVRERHIPEEELPVVFFLAQRARVAPDVIVKLRLGGSSWIEITHHYGLGADIFYVPVKNVSGPPYGKAYGYYKNKPRKEWKHIKLADDDVMNLVNLRFMSSYYGYSPEDVVKMRSSGKSFRAINKDIKANKGKSSNKIEKSEKSKSPKSTKSSKASKSEKASSKSKRR
jgi:hypothetical protein